MQQKKQSSKRTNRRHNYDRGETIAICLSDGPKTVADIEKFYFDLPRRFGMFIELIDREILDAGHFKDAITEDLEQMKTDGFIEQSGKYYRLSEKGEKKFAVVAKELIRFTDLVRSFGKPNTTGKVSLVVHLLLAAIKLPAGIISGSVGLLNDAADTFLDGISSILVLLGMRFNKERLVNIVLIFLMLATGGLALFESIQRILYPEQPHIDWFTFFSAIISAFLCTGLYFYQRYVGLQSGNLALITQSIDSRNHIIVAGSVTAGLLAALLDFPLLDTIVGLVVALIILYSAVELTIETIKNFNEEEIDLSRYSMAITEKYEGFRNNQLRNWLLYMMDRENITNRDEIHHRTLQVMDFTDNPALRVVGMNQQVLIREDIDHELDNMRNNGWLVGSSILEITNEGRKQLSKAMRQPRFLGNRQHF